MTTPRQLLLEKAALTDEDKAYLAVTSSASDEDGFRDEIGTFATKRAVAVALEAVGDLADALVLFARWNRDPLCYCWPPTKDGYAHSNKCQAAAAALARYRELRAGEDGDE